MDNFAIFDNKTIHLEQFSENNKHLSDFVMSSDYYYYALHIHILSLS